MLILTVVYVKEGHKRYSTRAMSSHVTLAELLAWAQENCRVDEQVGEVSFALETRAVEPARALPIDRIEIKPLSHRLFH